MKCQCSQYLIVRRTKRPKEMLRSSNERQLEGRCLTFCAKVEFCVTGVQMDNISVKVTGVADKELGMVVLSMRMAVVTTPTRTLFCKASSNWAK